MLFHGQKKYVQQNQGMRNSLLNVMRQEAFFMFSSQHINKTEFMHVLKTVQIDYFTKKL